MGHVEETPDVTRRIERQIEDIIGSLVMLADFEAGGRIESQQDFVFGMRPPKLFDDGPPLLEFAERSDVHPNDAGGGVNALGHATEPILTPLDPKFRFRVPKRHEPDDPCVNNQTDIIEPHRAAYVLFVFFQVAQR